MKTAILLCSIIFNLSFVYLRYADRIFERSVTQPSTRIFERYVPGYDVIFDYATNVLGFQPDLFLSVGLFLYIAKTSIDTARESITTLSSRYFLSSVTIEGCDDLYSCVLDWLIEQRPDESSRSLLATTNILGPWGYWNKTGSNIDSNHDFDFSDWGLQVPSTYAPGYEAYCHWHEGRPFWIHRTRSSPALGSPLVNTILLKCNGRSTKPIKDLIEHCRRWDHEKQKACTEIRRPMNKELRNIDRPWARTIRKRSRPMNTIILDVHEKSSIIEDLRQFLHPNTRELYHSRGIAYRRGLLLHGPPGTGKTSLSLALAGKFGLSIPCISLSDATLTDIDLGHLFCQLPDPCIILLEDVDATTTFARRRKTSVMNDKTKLKTDEGISLSGLLNAIDGVASGEGVILIMTTNHPDMLDDALIRAGRVDLRIEFRFPGKPELRDLFLRMYSNEAGSFQDALFGHGPSSRKSSVDVAETVAGTPRRKNISSAKLHVMAEHFAARLPESTFSGADIQGFLLLKK